MTVRQRSSTAAPESRCRRCGSLAAGLLAILPLLLLTACRDREGTSAPTASARSYTVEGTVRQLPDPGQAGVPLLIEHAPIPDFVDIHGQPAPMARMTMPFPVAEGVQLAGVAVGDRIVFELEVDWQAETAMLVTAIAKQPPRAPSEPATG